MIDNKMSRKEQIFMVCENIRQQGFKIPEELTINKVQETCSQLGFARGNIAYLTKYRNEWLKQQTQNTNSEEAESSPLMQSALNQFLLEQEQSIESKLKEHYQDKFTELSTLRDNALTELEHANFEIERLEQRLAIAQTKVVSLDNVLAKQLTQLEETNTQKAFFEYELSHARKALSDTKKEAELALQKQSDAQQKHLQALKAQSDGFKLQLDYEKELHQKTHDTLTAQLEQYRNEAVIREQQLIDERKKMQAQLYQLQADQNLLLGQNQDLQGQTSTMVSELVELRAALNSLTLLEEIQHANSDSHQQLNNLLINQNEELHQALAEIANLITTQSKPQKVKKKKTLV